MHNFSCDFTVSNLTNKTDIKFYTDCNNDTVINILYFYQYLCLDIVVNIYKVI